MLKISGVAHKADHRADEDPCNEIAKNGPQPKAHSQRNGHNRGQKINRCLRQKGVH